MNDPASPASSQPSPAYSRRGIATHPTHADRHKRGAGDQAAEHPRLGNLREVDILSTSRRARARSAADRPSPQCAARRPPLGTDHIHPSSYDSISVWVSSGTGQSPRRRHSPTSATVRGPSSYCAQLLRARDHTGAAGAVDHQRMRESTDRSAFDVHARRRPRDRASPARAGRRRPASRALPRRTFPRARRRCPTTRCCRSIAGSRRARWRRRRRSRRTICAAGRQ